MPSVRRDTTAMWSSPVPGFALFSHATFPWDTAPGYLLRDHDASYGQRERVEAMGITQVVTAPRSPRQNAYVERVIGLIRRECLDHIVIFNERYLRRVLSSYVDYYHRSRTHLSLDRMPRSLFDTAAQDRGSQPVSLHRTNSIATLAAAKISVPMEFSAETGLLRSANFLAIELSIAGVQRGDQGRHGAIASELAP